MDHLLFITSYISPFSPVPGASFQLSPLKSDQNISNACTQPESALPQCCFRHKAQPSLQCFSKYNLFPLFYFSESEFVTTTAESRIQLYTHNFTSRSVGDKTAHSSYARLPRLSSHLPCGPYKRSMRACLHFVIIFLPGSNSHCVHSSNTRCTYN